MPPSRNGRSGALPRRNAGTGRQANLFGSSLRSFSKPKPEHDRIGIVDVGSNSVRMVVFEGGRRCPAMVFNEKVLCGLGKDLTETQRLSEEGVERALRALKRFVALAPGLKIGALAGVATAAVRDAEDGAAFCDRVAAETGIELDVASGEDEARLAAQGVVFGEPAATGLVVDLGGASMELCPVKDGVVGAGVSTPLGPLRLRHLEDAKAAIAAELSPFRERFHDIGQRLYLVGGSWRALGRVEITRSEHPLPVLHEFSFDAKAARSLINYIADTDSEELAGVPGMPSGRVGMLQSAVLLLESLLDMFESKEIVISGFGLREGLCYDYLPGDVRGEDPLLSTCLGHEVTRSRSPGFGRELGRWIIKAMPEVDPAEDRLIRAACHLADVSWRAHPEYRVRACLEVVTRVHLSSAGHHGRALMAAMLLSRYKGGRKAAMAEPVLSLLTEEETDRCLAIGSLMRLGATISGATPGYLRNCPLDLSPSKLSLSLKGDVKNVMGEEIEKRLSQAARAFGVEAEIKL